MQVRDSVADQGDLWTVWGNDHVQAILINKQAEPTQYDRSNGIRHETRRPKTRLVLPFLSTQTAGSHP